MLFQSGDRLVFTGDSVTDMGRAQPVGEGLFDNVGRGYVRVIESLLAACYPEILLRVTNTGTDGHTSRDLLERFERDVVSLNPDWVSICIGINDVWRQFDSPAILDGQVMPEEYRQNMETMILSVKDCVKGTFLLSPYYMEPNLQDPMRRRMQEYVDICQALAHEHGCIFVNLQSLFDAYCSVRHSSYLAWDRIHPNQVGAALIAREFLKHCQFAFI